MSSDIIKTMENGWKEHQKLILHRLDKLDQDMRDMLNIQMENMKVLEALKLRSSFVAAIAGFIAAIGYNTGKVIYDIFNN